MTRLLLVRHGATPCTLARRFCGQHDPLLAPAGRTQAAALARAFERERVAAAVTSDLERACATAALALPRRVVRLDPAWREVDFGLWETLTHEEIAARYPTAYAAWCADPFATRVPGGESAAVLWERVRAACRGLAARHEDATVVVFTHAGPIAVLRAAAAGGAWDQLIAFLPEPGTVHAVTLDAAWLGGV